MNLSKVRNSDLISKALIGIIILSSTSFQGLAQNTPNNQKVVPSDQQTNGVLQNQRTTPLGPNQTRQNPTTSTTYGTGQENTVRNVGFTDGEIEAMTHEDSVAAAIAVRENEDLDLQTLRRKIFGYKLFNLQTYDPNTVVNIPTPNNYVLGANDELIIDIYGYYQNHEEVKVNADGFITLEKAGLIKVSGLSIEDAKERIRIALSKIYIGLAQGNTKLNVSLGDVRSIKISVTGEAVAPGSYTMTSLSTLTSALYRSGGPNEIGSFREIKLIRNNKVAAVLDLYDILMKGFSDADVLLKDQDVILIPTFINRVIINGQTKRTGYFELKPEEVLSDALTYAGGLAPDAYSHRIKIYRNNTREKQIIDVLNSDFNSFKIIRGDSIVVNRVLERFSNLVTIEGAVYRPGQYSLNNNNTVSQLIESADGVMTDALVGRLSLVRTNEDLTISNLSVNYSHILSGDSPDIPLMREDRIVVPSLNDLNEVAYVRIQGAINNVDAAEGVEIPYVRNLTLEDLLVQVGGLTEAASRIRVEIVRRKKNVEVSKENATTSDIILLELASNYDVNPNHKETVLQPYDEIFVRNSPNYEKQTYVLVEGEVLYPATYGIQSKEERISDIIKRSGGLTLQAYAPGATLIRTVQLSTIEIEQKRRTINDLVTSGNDTQVIEVDEIEETREEFIDIDLEEILKIPHSVGDLILQDGDIVKIPKLLETVRVQGEVLYPTTVKYLRNAGFKNYISGAGGFTRKSLKKKSYVLYPNGSVDRTRKFLVFNIYPRIQPGSEIIIPQKAQNNAEQLNRVSNILATLSGTLSTIFTIYGIVRLGK